METIIEYVECDSMNSIDEYTEDIQPTGYISLFLYAHLDNLDSQLLTQNQDCNTLCTAYYLVTFVITVYIARRSPDRSANINPESSTRFVPWESTLY